MDPDLAEEMLAAEEENPDAEIPDPTPEEYTLEAHLLLAVADKLSHVVSAIIAAAGVDPPRAEPMPRPTTALEQLRERKRLESVQDLIDAFTPREAHN